MRRKRDVTRTPPPKFYDRSPPLNNNNILVTSNVSCQISLASKLLIVSILYIIERKFLTCTYCCLFIEATGTIIVLSVCDCYVGNGEIRHQVI